MIIIDININVIIIIINVMAKLVLLDGAVAWQNDSAWLSFGRWFLHAPACTSEPSQDRTAMVYTIVSCTGIELYW